MLRIYDQVNAMKSEAGEYLNIYFVKPVKKEVR